MKTAVIIHGYPEKEEYFDPEGKSPSNQHWVPWLQHQLIIRGIFTQTPEMPDAYTPDYKSWKKTLEQFPINEETILIGHSCGAGFILRYLTETSIKIHKAILVAPWLDPNRELESNMFDFELNDSILSKTDACVLVHSSNDFNEVQISVEKILSVIPSIPYVEMQNKGHFCFEDLGTEAFPELLDIIV